MKIFYSYIQVSNIVYVNNSVSSYFYKWFLHFTAQRQFSKCLSNQIRKVRFMT